MTTKKTKISKVDNTVKDGAKSIRKSKVSKVNNKDTKKTKKRTYAKVKDKQLYALSMKMSKEYTEYIKTLNSKDLYSILKLHKFDLEYWKDYILEYKIDNKEKLANMITSLCKYLYYENSTFLKYLKSKEYKEKQDKNIAKKEDNKVASNIKDNSKAKKSFNKAIAKEVVKDNKK